MKAVVNVFLKPGVLDSQGKAVHHALDALKFDGINDVRVGRQIVLDVTAADASAATKEVTRMCESLLANTVIEDYTIEIRS